MLTQAFDDPDISEETWIDALIVGGLLLEDTNDFERARGFWRKVIATPNASEHQVRMAQNRLDANSREGRQRGQ